VACTDLEIADKIPAACGQIAVAHQLFDGLRARAARASAGQTPIARPNSRGRPGPSRARTASVRVLRGRSDQDSVPADLQTRHDDRPVEIRPRFVSNTISSSSSPTRLRSRSHPRDRRRRAPIRNRPAFATAMCCVPAEATRVRDPIPSHARSKVGKVIRGVTAGEKIQHSLEAAAWQVGERGGAADGGVERVDRDRP